MKVLSRRAETNDSLCCCCRGVVLTPFVACPSRINDPVVSFEGQQINVFSKRIGELFHGYFRLPFW